MKLPLLLAVLALAAPATASDLPRWDPQPTGIWYQFTFTDANGVSHALWCNPSQCGQGATGLAPLYEVTEVSRQPFTVNNGAFLPWNRESGTAYRTTYSSKLSHWQLDPRTREAVQGSQRVSARNQPQVSAPGSVWIVHPPTARLGDRFTAGTRPPTRPQPPPGRRQPPPDRRETPPGQSAPRGRILEFTLYGETGQLVDGRPYPEKESDWLSVAEHREFLAACPQRQGQAPTDTPACRQAVTVARGRIAQNMRDTVWLNGKTYRQRYQEIVTNLPADGPARDNRVTDLLVLLQAVKDKKYGQPPNTEHEVQLRAEERTRLGAAPAGARTASKTGQVLLQEYDTARAALEARDHVGLWQLTTRYRAEVPPPSAGPGTGPTQPGTALTPFTDAERRRLEDGGQGQLLRDYDAAAQARNEARQRELLEQGRRWLSEHPTAAEFRAIADENERRRICDRMNMERRAAAGTTGQVAPPDSDPARGSRAQLEARAGETRRGAPEGDRSRVMDGQVPPGTGAPAGYRWPPEIIADCEQLAGRTQPAPGPQPGAEPPPPAAPGSSNMTVGTPLGRPIAEDTKGKPPLASWNPLLNAAKGGLAGAIVGFALGGPLGMLVGALAFGGAAWGLTKIGDA